MVMVLNPKSTKMDIPGEKGKTGVTFMYGYKYILKSRDIHSIIVPG